MTAVDIESQWTSPEIVLEITNVAVSVLLPLVLLLLGLWVRQFGQRLERSARHSQIEIEWRLRVFQDLAPKLNTLYCYFNYVGGWRDMSPDDAVAAKRECDRIVHTNRFLWSPAFMEAYEAFVRTSFSEFQGPGRDLLLRANVDRHRENHNWREEWASSFVKSEDRVRREAFATAYSAVLDQAVRDLEIFSGS